MNQTVEALRSAGIVADEYKNPRSAGFEISIAPRGEAGTIMVQEAKAEIKVYPDPKFRQAVLNIKEGDREISQRMKERLYFSSRNDATESLIRKFKNRYRFPGVPIFRVEDLICQELKNGLQDWQGTVKAVFRVDKPTNLTLLTGMDEHYHFIAGLPKHVKSVEEAHEILKPKDLPAKKYIRQGEWFLVPTSNKLNNELMAIAKSQPPAKVKTRRFEYGSSHGAKMVMEHGKRQYALGFVYDDRGQSHHETLYLTRWHEVIRNREITSFDSNLRVRRVRWD